MPKTAARGHGLVHVFVSTFPPMKAKAGFSAQPIWGSFLAHHWQFVKHSYSCKSNFFIAKRTMREGRVWL
jgi:hypothetical protein